MMTNNVAEIKPFDGCNSAELATVEALSMFDMASTVTAEISL